MYIDIYDYFDRWMINYIVYHKEHLIEYGDVESANSHFSAQYQNAIEKMNSIGDEAYITSIQAQMQQQGIGAAKGLQILSDLEIGTLLESTLDQIAAGINQGIDLAGGQVTFDNYNAILQSARSFNNLLSAGQPEVQRVQQFFNLLLQGLEQAKLLDLTVLNTLSQIGTKLVGTSFYIDETWKNRVVTLSNQDIVLSQKVIDSLNRAVQKMGAEGSVSSRSFANTISYIFNKIIGNRIGQIIVTEGIKAGVETTDSLIDKAILQSGGKLSWVDKKQNNIGENLRGVATIFSGDSFNLKVTKNQQTFNIEIGTNVQTKWGNKKNTSNQILQSIAKTNLSDYFTDMKDKYLAYNMIAHRYTGAQFEQTFNTIRASTAASFFNDWVQQGGFKTSRGQNAQFLIIDGRVYSVYRIIKNICDDIMRNGGDDAFKLNIGSGMINKWQGNTASIVDAINRSNMVNQIIDKFTISATLNNNILKKYAY